MDKNKDDKIDKYKIEHGKTYYFDKSGSYIDEAKIKSLGVDCIAEITACCRIQLPEGFNFEDGFPNICFDLSNLTCTKNPIIQKVKTPTCDPKKPLECKVVGGYEVRVVGCINFATSTRLSPINGFCLPSHAHTCCTVSAPVNEIVSFSCESSSSIPSKKPCVDWIAAFFNTKRVEDPCGVYLIVDMGVLLIYIGE